MCKDFKRSRLQFAGYLPHDPKEAKHSIALLTFDGDDNNDDGGNNSYR